MSILSPMDAMNSDKDFVSGSEKGAVPAQSSRAGFELAPTTVETKYTVEIKQYSGYKRQVAFIKKNKYL